MVTADLSSRQAGHLHDQESASRQTSPRDLKSGQPAPRHPEMAFNAAPQVSVPTEASGEETAASEALHFMCVFA